MKEHIEKLLQIHSEFMTNQAGLVDESEQEFVDDIKAMLESMLEQNSITINDFFILKSTLHSCLSYLDKGSDEHTSELFSTSDKLIEDLVEYINEEALNNLIGFGSYSNIHDGLRSIDPSPFASRNNSSESLSELTQTSNRTLDISLLPSAKMVTIEDYSGKEHSALILISKKNATLSSTSPINCQPRHKRCNSEPASPPKGSSASDLGQDLLTVTRQARPSLKAH